MGVRFEIDVGVQGAPETKGAAAAVRELHTEVVALQAALAKVDTAKLRAAAGGRGAAPSKGKASPAGAAAAGAAGGAGDGVVGFLRRVFGRGGEAKPAAGTAGKGKPAKPKAEPKPKAEKKPKEAKPKAEKPEAAPSAEGRGASAAGKLQGAATALKGLRGGTVGAIAAVMVGISVATVGALQRIREFGTSSALAFRGLAAYNAQTSRLQLNLKRLFQGTDTSPLIRSAQRLADLFDRNRQVGSILSEVLTSGLGASFRVLERLVPLAESFAEGFLIGFFKVSTGAMRLAASVLSSLLTIVVGGGPAAKAIVSLYKAIKGGDAATTAGKVAFYAIAASLVAVGAAITLPALMLAGLAAAVVFVGKKVAGLVDELGIVKPLLYSLGVAAAVVVAPAVLGAAAVFALAYALGFVIDKATDAVRAVKGFLGIGEAATAVKGVGSRVKAIGAALPGAASAGEGEGAKASAAATGAAIGDGMISGMISKIAEITAAGAQMAAAADQGVRTKAEVRRPSRLFARTGLQFGAGVVVGLEKSGDAVARAAADNLVPPVPAPGADGAGAGGRGFEAKAAAGRAGGGAASVVFNGPVYVNGDPASASAQKGVAALFEKITKAAGGTS